MASPSKNVVEAVFGNLKRVVKLRHYLKQKNIDIVISMMTDANIIATFACLGTKMICIGSERNHPGKHQPGVIWQKLRKFTYYLTDVVVAQTESAEKWLQDNTYVRNTTIIPNPLVIPIPSIEPFKNTNLLTENKVVLTVGRLVDQKQFSHLIDIFKKLADHHPKWVLVIVGEGELRQALEEQVKQLGLTKRVFLPGRVGNISDWYKEANIFALTSKFEGFPNVLLEAMAHKVCVVSYDCDAGPAEIIEDGVTGRLVTANNKEEFYNVLNQLMHNDRLTTLIGNRAESSVIHKFEESKIMRSWEQLLHTKSSTAKNRIKRGTNHN